MKSLELKEKVVAYKQICSLKDPELKNFIDKYHHENKDKFNEKIKATNTKVNFLAEKVDRSLEIEPKNIAEKVLNLQIFPPWK